MILEELKIILKELKNNNQKRMMCKKKKLKKQKSVLEELEQERRRRNIMFKKRFWKNKKDSGTNRKHKTTSGRKGKIKEVFREIRQTRVYFVINRKFAKCF